jgi:signal transduction histidine kinase
MLLVLLARLASDNLNREFDKSNNIEGLLLCWVGILFFVARGQHKTLTAEAKRRREAEQEQRHIETQNHTLEYEVNQRTAALARQTDALRTTLQELRDTQDQLIQAEKMASLGELTAGIAHEIQNPLNFVNNFAEVSRELAQELAEERARPTRDPELEAELLTDLKQNLQRIGQHGQRAASIVRGMLEHSRASTGERTLTDLNALCDEYLRLAYHGLRAKDKSFNATLQTDFAPVLPLVEAVSQDLGRVLLNLFTNAFYAVRQRQQAAAPGYAPTVSVRTSFENREVSVVVRDNGTGMPKDVQGRIFQPFFTTKPSGEGTGLGLSLSYDIVVQGHGGTLEVASEEGVGTTFTIKLPV